MKKAAKFLGFTRSIWDNDGKVPLESKEWADLTEAQQNAACTLGYTKEKWGGDSESSERSIPENINVMSVIPEDKEVTVSEVVNYDNYDFKDLPDEVKEAARYLGYTSSIWDDDGTIPIYNNDWDDLTIEEQNAARVLGYSRDKWDHGSDSNSSSSPSLNPKTVQNSKKESFRNEKARVVRDVASSSDCETGAWANFSSICALDLRAPGDESCLRNTEYDTSSLIPRGISSEHIWIQNVNREKPSYHVTNYGNYRFDELPSDKQRAALILGFTRSTWDKNLFIPRKSKTWNSLSPSEMAAALSLGCTEEKWEKLLDSW